MEPTHKKTCADWETLLADWDKSKEAARQGQMAAHLQACPECARLAQEMPALCAALGTLPARQTSPAFEAQLVARLAALEPRKTHASWWAKCAQAWQTPPRLVRPALAWGAVTLVAAGAVLFEHPVLPTLSTAPPTLAADHALVLHCVEQQRTEAAAQPLSDLSAQNLAAQVDGASPADANANTASEDSL